MSEDFNLTYYSKETGVAYKVKKITRHDYIIMDEETKTKLPISKWALNQGFRACRNNGKNQKRVRIDFRKKKSA